MSEKYFLRAWLVSPGHTKSVPEVTSVRYLWARPTSALHLGLGYLTLSADCNVRFATVLLQLASVVSFTGNSAPLIQGIWPEQPCVLPMCKCRASQLTTLREGSDRLPPGAALGRDAPCTRGGHVPTSQARQ